MRPAAYLPAGLLLTSVTAVPAAGPAGENLIPNPGSEADEDGNGPRRRALRPVRWAFGRRPERGRGHSKVGIAT